MDLECKKCLSKSIKIFGGWECIYCGYFESNNCPQCPDFDEENVEQVLCNKHFDKWLATKGY